MTPSTLVGSMVSLSPATPGTSTSTSTSTLARRTISPQSSPSRLPSSRPTRSDIETRFAAIKGVLQGVRFSTVQQLKTRLLPATTTPSVASASGDVDHQAAMDAVLKRATPDDLIEVFFDVVVADMGLDDLCHKFSRLL
ncbi:hypothetical protein BC831DRAFT_472169 [Entophlyctis helioformis]|nr:hypothetical protein BC831DRAFT_472169 [Entophlyctis helioformis]